MSSNDLNDLSYVVLVLIGSGGAAPHDLVRMARAGQRTHWAGAASKMYEEPKRLSRLGYLRARKEPGRTRERTFYTLTSKGRRALRAWLAEPTAFPRIKNEAAVRVLGSDLADDPRSVVDSLRPLREQIVEQAAILDDAETSRRAGTIPHRDVQRRLVNSLGRRLLEAQLEWIDEVERELGRRDAHASTASSHR
jgi:DNA-binding PadR family transcriptional regulator